MFVVRLAIVIVKFLSVVLLPAVALAVKAVVVFPLTAPTVPVIAPEDDKDNPIPDKVDVVSA